MNRIIEKWRNVPLAVKVSTAYAMCSILQKCLSFLTLPLFTRLLTTEQYGQYTIYQSWSSILTIFLTLNLAYGSFSTAMVKFEKHRDTYISSLQGICLVLCAVFILIYFPLKTLWNQLFRLPTFLVLIMVLEILTTAGMQFWTGKKRFEYKYKSVIFVTLLQSFAAPLLALILVQHSEEKGYARIIGYAFVYIVIGGILFCINFFRGKRVYSKEFWRYAFRFNTPLIVYYLSQMIFNQSDRIMIDHYCGEGDAAQYGVAYNLAMVLTFILNAINNSYVPWFYGKIKEGKTKENQTVASGIALIMALLLLCVIWYAPEIIRIMAGEQYMEAVGVVAPVAMSLLLLFYAQLFINIEFYYEERRLLVLASIAAAVLNIVLNALLIPRFTFVVAGYTTLASYVVFVICNYFAMVKTLRIHGQNNDAYQIVTLVVIFMAFLACGFLGVALYNFLAVRIVITVIVFLILLYFRQSLISIIKTIRK